MVYYVEAKDLLLEASRKSFMVSKKSCRLRRLLSLKESFSRSEGGTIDGMLSLPLFHVQLSDLPLYGGQRETRPKWCPARLRFTGSLVIRKVAYLLLSDVLYPGDGGNGKGAWKQNGSVRSEVQVCKFWITLVGTATGINPANYFVFEISSFISDYIWGKMSK